MGQQGEMARSRRSAVRRVKQRADYRYAAALVLVDELKLGHIHATAVSSRNNLASVEASLLEAKACIVLKEVSCLLPVGSYRRSVF